MSHKQVECQTERIELFLRQQLGDDEQADFERHLDDCDDCCRHLEQLAAAADVWTSIRESLHEESPSLDSADGSGGSNGSAASEAGPPFSVESVLKLLAPTDDDRMLGRLGTYEVMGIIGTGGMGVVLKAFDPALNRYVAIKILSPHLGNSGAARKRFSREAQAAAAVVHDNVIEIHGVADANGLPYLVMPYVRGPSLQKRLDDDGSLSVVEILRIGKQAAAGLAAAHAQGLVHRDVKPANILLADGIERVKLTDFGLARAADDASLTKTGVIAGTPQYMSPEQARGDAIDATSDLFSLGSVMYTMCTGRPPFRAETSYGILRRITDTEPRPIREVNPEIPDWLCGIIAKLMAKDPEDRFDSADEVAELLEDCLAHVQQPATVSLPWRKLPACKPPRHGGTSPRGALRIPRPKTLRLMIGLAFAFSLFFAGILIVLEMNKGQLTIHSEANDVPIRIMQGDEVVENLTVSKSGKTIRIAAGRYQVEIGGSIDGIAIADGTVTLKRGGEERVRIVRTEGVAAAPLAGTGVQQSDMNARRVVESFVRASAAADVSTAVSLVDPDSAAEARQLSVELRAALDSKSVVIHSVLVSDKKRRALAVSAPVKLAQPNSDGQDSGRILFRLIQSAGVWRIKDVDFESQAGATRQAESFKEAHRDAKESVDEPPSKDAGEVEPGLGERKAGIAIPDIAVVEAQIRNKLDATVTLNCEDKPLHAVIKEIANAAGIANVLLDNQGMAAEGVTGGEPVTVQLEHPIRLSSALRLVLEPLHLEYVIENEVLKITGERIAVYPKLYDVTRNLRFIPDPANADRTDDAGPPGGSLTQALDALADLITSTVAPESWDAKGGPGAIAPFPERVALVIAQTKHVHDQIDEFLAHPDTRLGQRGAQETEIVPGTVDSTHRAALGAAEADADEITIDIYCGEDLLPEMNTSPSPVARRHSSVVQLLFKLNALKDVTTNFRAAGPGNEIAMVIVRDPSQRCRRESAGTGKPSKVRTAIDSAMKAAGIRNVRWEQYPENVF